MSLQKQLLNNWETCCLTHLYHWIYEKKKKRVLKWYKFIFLNGRPILKSPEVAQMWFLSRMLRLSSTIKMTNKECLTTANEKINLIKPIRKWQQSFIKPIMTGRGLEKHGDKKDKYVLPLLWRLAAIFLWLTPFIIFTVRLAKLNPVRYFILSTNLYHCCKFTHCSLYISF